MKLQGELTVQIAGRAVPSFRLGGRFISVCACLELSVNKETRLRVVSKTE